MYFKKIGKKRLNSFSRFFPFYCDYIYILDRCTTHSFDKTSLEQATKFPKSKDQSLIHTYNKISYL